MKHIPMISLLVIIGVGISQLSLAIPYRESQAPAACATQTIHPLQVDVHLVGTLAPNKAVVARLTIESTIDLNRLEIDLAAERGVQLLVRPPLQSGAVAAGSVMEYEFSLMVTDQAAPLQIQIDVRGFVGDSALVRGTVLHLLPQGRHNPTMLQATMPGKREQQVLEHRQAVRKIQP